MSKGSLDRVFMIRHRKGTVNSRENVVQSEVGEGCNRPDAAERAGVVGVHERADERLVGAESTDHDAGFVVFEVTTAGEL